MNAILLTIFLFISAILYGRPENKKEIIIHGVIKNVHECISYIYLICIGGRSREGDSIKVINNRYTCIIKTDYVAMITFYAKSFSDPASLENKNLFVILAEPGNCNIVSMDSFSNISVSGSRAFIEYCNLKKNQFHNSFEIKRLQLVTDSLQNTSNVPESTIQRLYKQIDSLYQKNGRLYLDYTKSSPLSLIAPYVLLIYFNHVSDEGVRKNVAVYDLLSTAGKSSAFGKEIKSRIENAKIGIGVMAPEFTQTDTASNRISLQSFRGKYVLLDFWASWCLPCRGENTHLVKAFNDYYEKGFTIISISLDKADAKDKWLRAINSDGLTWTNISDLKGFENTVAKLYYITAIPQNFLIDPGGKIIAKNLRNGNLEKKMNEIFASQ